MHSIVFEPQAGTGAESTPRPPGPTCRRPLTTGPNTPCNYSYIHTRACMHAGLQRPRCAPLSEPLFQPCANGSRACRPAAATCAHLTKSLMLSQPTPEHVGSGRPPLRATLCCGPRSPARPPSAVQGQTPVRKRTRKHTCVRTCMHACIHVMHVMHEAESAARAYCCARQLFQDAGVRYAALAQRGRPPFPTGRSLQTPTGISTLHRMSCCCSSVALPSARSAAHDGWARGPSHRGRIRVLNAWRSSEPPAAHSHCRP